MKAFLKFSRDSKFLSQTMQALENLAKNNNFTLTWIPEHIGIRQTGRETNKDLHRNSTKRCPFCHRQIHPLDSAPKETLQPMEKKCKLQPSHDNYARIKLQESNNIRTSLENYVPHRQGLKQVLRRTKTG